MTLTGTFSVYDLSNNLLALVQFAVPPGAEVVRGSSASDLNLPQNHSGYALFSHNGPPGAIVADAYLVSPTVQVTYAKFEGIGGH